MDSHCCICLENTMNNGNSILTKCCHRFHKECFSKIKDARCPLCRTDIVSLPLVEHAFEFEPFVWNSKENVYTLPESILSIDSIYNLHNSLLRDLRMATVLELSHAVHATRRRRIRSIERYSVLYHRVVLS